LNRSQVQRDETSQDQYNDYRNAQQHEPGFIEMFSKL
jgi:hypothetical protein